MNKKGFGIYEFLILLVIIGVLVYLLVINSQQEGSLLNRIVNSDGQTQIIKETETIKINLCNVMQPYIIASGINDDCIAYGGEWTCKSDYVGCSNIPTPVVTCSGPAMTSAIYQCEQMGGEGVCNPTNFYCAYE